MTYYKVEEIKNKKTWESYVLSQNPKSFLQSWNWGETNNLVGKKIFRLGFYKDGKLIGVGLVIKEIARRGSHFLIPGGPLIDWNKRGLVNFFLKTVKDLAQREKVWFVRIRPEILDSEKSRDLFSKLGFISAPMHLHAENTWVLDISLKEEDILLGMRKTTRYLVRKSLASPLIIKVSIDQNDAKILTKLQKETVARHSFVGFSEKLFKAQISTFGVDNQAGLYVCEHKGVPLVAAIIIFYGNYAYYHHSASSEKARDIPASYFLQWRVIQEAKKRNLKYYNFWGIAPSDNPKHRFAGVTIFKKGFGGERIDWLHAQDLPVNSLYWLTYCFEKLRKATRRL